jgi:hypothetical protein
MSVKTDLILIPKQTHYYGDLRIEYLIKGKFYEGELCPTMYDKITYQVLPQRVIVKCEDQQFRLYILERDFITLSEWREKQINLILEDE